jgi:ribosomal protein L11 methyltransferase
MPYVTLTTEVPLDAAELAESLLHDAGCAGLEVRDADTKPMPGQRAPAPGSALLVAFFMEKAEADDASASLREEWPSLAVDVVAQKDEDWSEAWKRQVKSTQVGRLWVGPPWDAPGAPAHLVKLVIEPGMAFGTGDHPTTRFCLGAVDEAMAALPGADVLDVGTGSGVLAMAARRLGAGRVVGTDNDPVAIRVAIENAELNHIERVEFSTKPLENVPGTFPLVLANIHANVLVELAPLLVAKLAPKGRLYLAGILVPQVDEVLTAYVMAGLYLREQKVDGEWALLSLQREPK